MKLIESKTLGTAQASIEFTSVPQTFTDLLALISTRNSNGGATAIRFNSNSSGYSERLLYGNGSSAASANRSGSETVWLLSALNSSTANTFSNGQVYIPNYTGSTNKSFSMDSVNETNATGADQYLDAALWSNTAAITNIQFFNPDGNFAIGTTISLYGVLKGSDGIVTTS
jgi:hypothetical protein